MNDRPGKQCNKCRQIWDLEACYRKRNRPHEELGAPSSYHPTCVMCELTDRNDPTPEERARRKAQNSIILHAEKFNMKPKDFAKRYGWDVERMIYDIIHGHENTCPYCYERYDVMGHGLTDITLDVVNPKEEPYYRTNVRWCCATCNSEKAAMPPHLWAIRCAAWPIYMEYRQNVKNNVTFGLPLFDD